MHLLIQTWIQSVLPNGFEISHEVSRENLKTMHCHWGKNLMQLSVARATPAAAAELRLVRPNDSPNGPRAQRKVPSHGRQPPARQPAQRPPPPSCPPLALLSCEVSHAVGVGASAPWALRAAMAAAQSADALRLLQAMRTGGTQCDGVTLDSSRCLRTARAMRKGEALLSVPLECLITPDRAHGSVFGAALRERLNSKNADVAARDWAKRVQGREQMDDVLLSLFLVVRPRCPRRHTRTRPLPPPGEHRVATTPRGHA